MGKIKQAKPGRPKSRGRQLLRGSRFSASWERKFNLGRFHEACLDHGTLPVKYLPEVVRERLKTAR